jgi:hypothetical protein
MILFPKTATASERYILLMFIEHGGNKKAAAHFSNVGVRRSQIVIKKYSAWLNGYKEKANKTSPIA